MARTNLFFFLSVFFLFGFFSITVLSQLAACGNGAIDPGEACDPGTDGSSFGGDNIFPFPGGLNDCNTLDQFLIGPLGCYGSLDNTNLLCQFNVQQCEPRVECLQCDNCGWLLGIGCSQNLCVNFCPGFGSCYFNQNMFLDRCQNCGALTSCFNYTNMNDCTRDSCVLLIRDSCPGTECRMPEEQGYICNWENNKCVPDERCKWDCSNLYGPCQGDFYRHKNQDVGCTLIESNLLNAPGCQDPSVNYPSRVSCNLFEKNFSVFTRINLFLSLIFLLSFYIITSFKKNKHIENNGKKR